MAKFWIKLRHSLIGDPKIARLPDHIFRRFIEVNLIAGTQGNEGNLPNIQDLAWLLHSPEDEIKKDLTALEGLGVVHQAGSSSWIVTHFKEEQDPDTSTERVHNFRQSKKRNESETKRFTDETHIELELKQESELKKKIKLNKEKEITKNFPSDSINPNGKKNIVPNEMDVGRIFAETTGMVFMPNGDHRGEYVEAICQMLKSYGHDETLKRMKKAYDAWLTQHTKAGRQYSKTNLAWINYAVAGEVPGGNGSKPKPKSVAEEIAEELSKNRNYRNSSEGRQHYEDWETK